MIKIDEWDIFDSNQFDPSTVNLEYSHSFTGSELTLDQRSEWIKEYASFVSEKCTSVVYDVPAAELVLDGVSRYSVNTLDNIISSGKRVLFDATSLLLPELLYLMDWANSAHQDFDVIYVEPFDYTRKPHRSKIGSHSIDYSLSEDGPGVSMLPKFVFPTDNRRLVISLGYEGHRFGSLLISDEINPVSITGILGSPPFELGWEKNTYAHNHSYMREARRNYEGDFICTAANDPLQNYRTLVKILKSEGAQRGRPGGLQVAPIGTKPSALAMAWFAINNKGTGVLYDFIIKTKERTTGVGKIHTWKFSIT